MSSGHRKESSHDVSRIGSNDLRVVFEVHGVVMIPIPSPDETMLLENLRQLEWHAVAVNQLCAGFAQSGVFPIVSILGHTDVDGSGEGM